MKLTRREIVAKFQNIWPDLVDGLPGSTNIAMPDTEYWCPTLKELEELINKCPVDQYKAKRGILDCDDYALLLHAWIIQETYNLGYELPWALGEVWGTMFKGRQTGHAINACITSDAGLVFIEPQNMDIWPVSEGDKVHFVRM